MLECENLKMSNSVKKHVKQYEEIYATTENALKDLVNRKIASKMDEEIPSEEELVGWFVALNVVVEEKTKDMEPKKVK